MAQGLAVAGLIVARNALPPETEPFVLVPVTNTTNVSMLCRTIRISSSTSLRTFFLGAFQSPQRLITASTLFSLPFQFSRKP